MLDHPQRIEEEATANKNGGDCLPFPVLIGDTNDQKEAQARTKGLS